MLSRFIRPLRDESRDESVVTDSNGENGGSVQKSVQPLWESQDGPPASISLVTIGQ